MPCLSARAYHSGSVEAGVKYPDFLKQAVSRPAGFSGNVWPLSETFRADIVETTLLNVCNPLAHS